MSDTAFRGAYNAAFFDAFGDSMIEPRQVFTFNGTDQYATIPEWFPTGYPAKISFSCRVDLPSGKVQTVVGSSQNRPVVKVLADGRIQYQGIDTGDVNFLMTTTGTATAGMVMRDTVLWEDAQSSYSIDALPPTKTNVGVQRFTTAGIARIADNSGGNQSFSGPIWNLALVDELDPSNSRLYRMNEGTGSTLVDGFGDGSTDGTIVNYTDNWGDTLA